MRAPRFAQRLLDRDWKNLAWTSSTYFAEGLPWSLLHQVSAEYFNAIGLKPAAIGYTSLLHGANLLKVVWSPLVALFGTLRRWMVATQLIMGTLVGVLALLAHRVALSHDPAHGTTWIWVVLAVLGVLSATHDIACDGYYLEMLSAERQAAFSGARVAGFRAAMLVGSSGLVFIGGLWNWLYAFGLAAVLLWVCGLLHQLLLPTMREPNSRAIDSRVAEPRQDKPETPEHAADAPTDETPARKIRDAYSTFLRQKGVLFLFAFLLTYKMADVVMFAMSKVFFKNELGIGTDLRGLIGFIATASSVAGAVLGGTWIARRGIEKTLFPITLVMALTAPLYAILAHLAGSLNIAKHGVPATLETATRQDLTTLSIVSVVVLIEQLSGGLATAAQAVFIMRKCAPAHKAAHFAFATAIYSAAQMAVGAYSGAFYEKVGPVTYFWVVVALMLPALFLALVMPKEASQKHRISA